MVEADYRFHDLMLGTMLRQISDDVTVVTCSNHGFHPDHLRPVQIPKEPAGPAIEQPAAVAERVNAFLGGQLDETALAGVVDPSLYRQRAVVG